MKRRNVFKGTDKLQKTYKCASERQIKVDFGQERIETGDEKFLGELIEYIKQNLANPNLSVENASRDMKMCRVSLYRKLLMLTGKSPVELIRAMRLQKAVHLLENTEMIISRIAQEVGYETPQYFAKLFKREFDMLPSAYACFARKAKVEVILNAYGVADTIKTAGLIKNI